MNALLLGLFLLAGQGTLASDAASQASEPALQPAAASTDAPEEPSGLVSTEEVETAPTDAPAGPSREFASGEDAPASGAEVPTVDTVPSEAPTIIATYTTPEIDCALTYEMVKSRIDTEPLGAKLLLALNVCDKRRENENAPGTHVVSMVDDKYFYDFIPASAAKKGVEACNAAVVITLVHSLGVLGKVDSGVTMGLYQEGQKSCDELLQMAKNDNPILILNPVVGIHFKLAQRGTGMVLDWLHLYDDYKDATKYLDEQSRAFHRSFNEDFIELKEFVVKNPVKASAYLQNPAVAHIYENRVRIGRELEREAKRIERQGKRVGGAVEDVGRCVLRGDC